MSDATIDARRDGVATLSVSGMRPENDDRVLAREDLGLYAIADGLGGALGGAVAADLAIRGLEDRYARVADETFDASAEALASRLREAVEAANRAVFEERRGANVAMGTTLVALARSRHHVAVAHVGDSRALRFARDSVETLTRDHSIRALLVGREPSADFLARYGHLVTRALGSMPRDLDVDVRVDPRRSGDRFLLASDGLTEFVAEARIADALRRASRVDVAALLVDRAIAGGSTDNVSVLVLDLGEPGAHRPSRMGVAACAGGSKIEWVTRTSTDSNTSPSEPTTSTR